MAKENSIAPAGASHTYFVVSSHYLSGAGSVECNDEAKKEMCIPTATRRLFSATAQLIPDIVTS